MPPKPPTKSKYEQSLEKTVRGQRAFAVPTSAVRKGSSSKYSVVIYSTGNYAGKARLLEWTPDGSRIATGRTISIDEANILAGRGTDAQRGSVSPGGGAPSTVSQLEQNVAALENAPRNSVGDYLVNGRYVLPSEYNKALNNAKDELAKARGRAGESAQAGAAAGSVQQMNAQDQSVELGKVSAQLYTLVGYADDLIAKSTDRTVVSNARAWKSELEKRIKSIDSYLATLEKTMRVDPAFVAPAIPTFDQIDSTRPTQPVVTGPEVPVTGPGQYGVMPSTSAGQVAPTGPVPAGQRGEQAMGAAPTTPSRMPTLDEVNKQRTAQGLRALVVRNGRVVDPTTGQEVPNVSTTAPGQGAVVTPTVPGGGTGGAAVGGTPAGTVPPAAGTQLVGSNGQVALIPPSWEEAARMEAGAWWDIFKDNEEMRKFIADWMARPMVPGADPFGEAFDLALRKTNWWLTTDKNVRQWTELTASDPATAKSTLEGIIKNLKKLALDRGLSTDEGLLRKAGLDIAKFGFSPEVALNNLASGMLQTSTGASELRQGFYGQSVRQLANKYGIAMSDSAITNNAGQVATGQQTLASLEAQFREQAKIMYPSLAGGLDRGLSFQDMASPYARYASSILEIPEEQIDFTDPKWSAAFNTRDDKGNLSQMSFSEWADYLRKDPQFGWEYTDNAKSQVYDIALQIGRMFGRAG